VSYPVYSERFLALTTPGAWLTYLVPAGRRAIVRNVIATNTNPVAGHVYVKIAAVAVAWITFPAAVQSQSVDLYQVAYAGELISVYAEIAQVHCSVSGYLLTDGTGRTGPPGGTSTEGQPPSFPSW
jgi:hypothetical protein